MTKHLVAVALIFALGACGSEDSNDNKVDFSIAQFKTTNGTEIRVDDIELSYQGAPAEGTEALFDSIRLVSHPLSPEESIALD
ncbi:hypothetical protein [Thalassotalea crassostreae]|uniref:hypothetical protein n=1 Tax=Thalassotalea crassostreae TaxID=1763536 RepID=UPI00083922BB|nr:hypothetical protein [Thalassotalea crassostreae]